MGDRVEVVMSEVVMGDAVVVDPVDEAAGLALELRKAEAAAEAALQEVKEAGVALDLARERRDAAHLALERANSRREKFARMVEHERCPKPVWLEKPWAHADLRVATDRKMVFKREIVLRTFHGNLLFYNEKTGYLWRARGAKKASYGRLDVAATLKLLEEKP